MLVSEPYGRRLQACREFCVLRFISIIAYVNHENLKTRVDYSCSNLQTDDLVEEGQLEQEEGQDVEEAEPLMAEEEVPLLLLNQGPGG